MFAEMRRLYLFWRTHAVRSLRAEKEAVNFYCSHRCTSGATLGQGRAGVLAPVRPVLSQLRVTFSSSAFAVDRLLHFLQLGNVILRPKAITDGTNQSRLRSLYLSLRDPPLQRS